MYKSCNKALKIVNTVNDKPESSNASVEMVMQWFWPDLIFVEDCGFEFLGFERRGFGIFDRERKEN